MDLTFSDEQVMLRDSLGKYLERNYDFETRRAVYSLWPALVHFRLFGSGYRAMIEGFLTEAGH